MVEVVAVAVMAVVGDMAAAEVAGAAVMSITASITDPSTVGNYHRPGGGAQVDNSLPGRRYGDHNRPDRPDRPGDGGDNNRPGGGHGGDSNDYYFGWDNPSYGSGLATGIATGLAIGTFVYTFAAYLRVRELWWLGISQMRRRLVSAEL